MNNIWEIKRRDEIGETTVHVTMVQEYKVSVLYHAVGLINQWI